MLSDLSVNLSFFCRLAVSERLQQWRVHHTRGDRVHSDTLTSIHNASCLCVMECRRLGCCARSLRLNQVSHSRRMFLTLPQYFSRLNDLTNSGPNNSSSSSRQKSYPGCYGWQCRLRRHHFNARRSPCYQSLAMAITILSETKILLSVVSIGNLKAVRQMKHNH
jgi:hypothetical protein